MSSEKTDTRTRILQTTLQLLESGQGETVRMADIARKAGISRQAVYLHFATRAELLIATTFYLDELKDSEARLAASRSAASGVERLEAFIDAWGSYIPEVYGMAKGGGHWMDLSRISIDYLGIGLPTVAFGLFLACWATPILAYAFYRWEPWLQDS